MRHISSIICWLIVFVAGAKEQKSIIFLERPRVEFDHSSLSISIKVPQNAAGTLVLLDGQNLSPANLIKDPAWQKFAREHNLAICGAEFVSDPNLLRIRQGYYDAAAGAGAALREALAKEGLGDKPILLYGISGGARFVNSFVTWRPEGVRAWAAFAVTDWVPPPAGKRLPPGLVACGQLDDQRHGACLDYVQRARAQRQPVGWVSLPELPHRRSLELEEFVREFFASALRDPTPEDGPVAVDIGKETEITPREPWEFLVSAELPSRALVPAWRALHQP